MPVPYCLDDYGFVGKTEVRQVDPSSSILLSQDCFGYSSFFVFCFYFRYSRGWVIENPVIYVKECSMFSSKIIIVSDLQFRSLIS